MKKRLNLSFPQIILIVSLIAAGSFYEYVSCFLSAAMLIWLTAVIIKNKKLRFSFDLMDMTFVFIVLCYAISILWAVDRGMALIGFFKFLPILLYILVLRQTDSTDNITDELPYIAAALTAVSGIGMYIPALSGYFSVAGRLAGTFQYPNSFALFLLIAELYAISQKRQSVLNIITVAVLIFGIILTGSRTVLVLAILANSVLIFKTKSKKIKLVSAVTAALGAAAVTAYELLIGLTGPFGRLFSISFSQSTFVGRLLYFSDSFSLIIRHPFGMGYMGYGYTHQSVQSGVYSVMYVHNDFLQLMLDIGWIPCFLLLTAIFVFVFKRSAPFYKKLLVTVITIHCMFDFDFQFISIFLMLVLLMYNTEAKEHNITSRSAAGALCSLIAVINMYAGTSLLFTRIGNYKTAQLLLPFNTQNELRLLIFETDLSTANGFADDILSRNENVKQAYAVKAKYAFSKGDFGSVIQYYGCVFALSPFETDAYNEYCGMLITGLELYERSGDQNSAAICRQELKKTAETIHNFNGRLSALGKRIDDQPVTKLNDDIEEYIKSIK